MSTESTASISCHSCNASYRWKPELAGRKVKCKCGSVIVVPTSAPAAAVARSPVAATAPGSSEFRPTKTAASPDGVAAQREDSVTTAASTPATSQKSSSTKWPLIAGILVACGLIYIWSGEIILYFRSSPDVIDNVSQVAGLSHRDYVEIRLPLADDYSVYEKQIGDDKYALIEVAGTNGRLQVCISEPGEDAFAVLPKPLVGRIVAHESKKTGWRIDGGAQFPIPTSTLLFTPGKPRFASMFVNSALSIVAAGFIVFATISLLRKATPKTDTDAEADEN